MNDLEKMNALLTEIGEVIAEKNKTLDTKQWRIGELEKRIDALHTELESAYETIERMKSERIEKQC